MLEVIHSLSGQVVNPPVNQDDVSIGFVNHITHIERTNTTKEFTWVDDEAKIIQDWLDNGKLFDKLTHTIDIVDGSDKKTFNRYLDLSAANFDNDKIDADSTTDKKLDWFTKHVAGISFERLYEEGKITDSDFTQVPYVISSIPDYRGAFLTILSITMMSIELNDSINELAAIAGELATVIDSVGALVRVLIRLVWIILKILTLVELLLDLVALLIQRVKYIPAMSFNQMLSFGLAEVGLKLGNSIIPDDHYYIPKTFEQPDSVDDSRIKGIFYPNQSTLTGYYRGSMGRLWQLISDMYFAKLDLRNTTVNIVPYNEKPTAANVTIPDVDQDAYRINARNIPPLLQLSFTHDVEDDNTITNWTGTNVEVRFRPANGQNPTYNPFSDQGVVRVFPFALCTRKDELTVVEKIVDVLGRGLDKLLNVLIKGVNAITDAIDQVTKFIDKTINKVLKFFGANPINLQTNIPTIPKTSFGSQIEDRIGMLSLENDHFTVDKIVKLQVSQEPRLTKVVSKGITAKKFYYDYWQGVKQQIYEFPLKNIELNLPQVLTVESELTVVHRGNVCRVKSMDWNGTNTGGLADMEIELFKEYVSIKEEISEPKAA